VADQAAVPVEVAVAAVQPPLPPVAADLAAAELQQSPLPTTPLSCLAPFTRLPSELKVSVVPEGPGPWPQQAEPRELKELPELMAAVRPLDHSSLFKKALAVASETQAVFPQLALPVEFNPDISACPLAPMALAVWQMPMVETEF